MFNEAVKRSRIPVPPAPCRAWIPLFSKSCALATIFLLTNVIMPEAAEESLPAIRITGPDGAPIGTEITLHGEAANSAAEKILARGGFFEWVISGTPLATGPTFRCRSADPAEYDVELRLRRNIGNRVVTEAASRHLLVFSQIRLAPPKPPPAPSSLRWILKSQRSYFETNEQRAAQNLLELGDNSCLSRSTQPGLGIIEWRVRWPALPNTLTPGNRLIFDIKQEMRLASYGSTPLAATAHARFFALSKTQHERIMESMTETLAAGETNRFLRTKRVQWQIPTGHIGDKLSLELGGQSAAGIVSYILTYQMGAVTDRLAAPPPPTPSVSKAPTPSPAPLRLTLFSDTTNVPVGSIVHVRAVPQGGSLPLRFAWTVDGMALTDTTARIMTQVVRPGPMRVRTEAMDAAGQSAQATLTLKGKAPELRVTKLTPAGQTVFLGERVCFRAEVLGRMVIPASQCRFRWISDEAVAFDALETETATNTARFYRSGIVTVRVELVYAPTSLAFELLAQSAPYAIHVLPPAVAVVFDPESPYVGEGIKLQVRSDPAIPGMEARWLNLPSNVEVLNRSADGRDLRCLLKDTQPAVFKVELALPRFGRIGAEATARVIAKPRRVILSGPVGGTPMPQVWREGKGPVTLTNEFMPGQPLRFAAALAPSNAEVRWAWSLSDPDSTLDAPRSATPKVVCANTGRYEIIARAYDARGIELGAARKTFTVNISSEAVAEAQRREKAAALREKGFALLRESQIAEAIRVFRESYTLWPSEELSRHIEQLEQQLSHDQAAAEQAVMLRRAEEERRARAEQLKRQAWEHIESKRYELALAAFEQSLDLHPDAQLEEQVRMIREAVEKRRAKQAEAQRLRKEAEAFEEAGHLKKALEAYRASYASWQDDAVEQAILRLEKRIAAEAATEIEIRRLMEDGAEREQQGDWDGALRSYQKAQELRASAEAAAAVARLQEKIRQRDARRKAAEQARKEGNALQSRQRTEEALLKYHEALRLWPDPQLAKHVENLEQKWRRKRETRDKAAQSRDRAAALAIAGDLQGALAAYRESIALVPDPDLDRRIREIEAELERREAVQAQARRLADEAARWEAEGQWTDALAAYRDSLALEYSSNVAARLQALERKLETRWQRQVDAAALREQAAAAAAEGLWEKAVDLYRKSLRLETNAPAAEQLAKLEKKLQKKQEASEKASQLYREGLALEQQDRLEEAAAKYRECLMLHRHDEAQRRLSVVRRLLQRQAAEKQRLLSEQKARERTAAKLREEGRLLEEKGKWEEAVARYRTSLDLVADSDLERHIRDLETQFAEKAEKGRRASALCEEARKMLLADRLEEAIQKYEESLSYRADPLVQDTLARLKKDLQKRQEQSARAAALRSEAQECEQAGQFAKAAELLRESLLLHSDPETRRQLAKVEARLREQSLAEKAAAVAAESQRKAAQKFFDEAAELGKAGQFAQAVAKYKSGLNVSADPAIAQKVAALEQQLDEIQQANEEAPRQAAEEAARGEELEKQGRWADAMRAYQRSLELASSPGVEERLKTLLQRVAERDARHAQAAKLQNEGQALAAQKDWAGALAKYRESLALWLNPKLEKEVAQIVEKLEREKRDHELAQRLRQEGERLESEGRLDEALAKYRESAAIRRDEELDALIARTYRLVEQRRAKSEMADQIWAEGMTQFRKGKHREGLALLKQSLVLYPDDKRQNVLTQLEAWLASAQAPEAQLSTTTLPAVERKAPRPAESSLPSARTQIRPPPSPPSPVDALAGSRWKGVALFHLGDDWIQWPLQVTVHASHDLAGLSVEHDPRTQEPVEYSVNGIYEPQQKAWYMACVRRDRRSLSKATLSGSVLSETTAGGSATLILQDAGGRQNIKGLWRLLRVESAR